MVLPMSSTRPQRSTGCCTATPHPQTGCCTATPPSHTSMHPRPTPPSPQPSLQHSTPSRPSNRQQLGLQPATCLGLQLQPLHRRTLLQWAHSQQPLPFQQHQPASAGCFMWTQPRAAPRMPSTRPHMPTTPPRSLLHPARPTGCQTATQLQHPAQVGACLRQPLLQTRGGSQRPRRLLGRAVPQLLKALPSRLLGSLLQGPGWPRLSLATGHCCSGAGLAPVPLPRPRPRLAAAALAMAAGRVLKVSATAGLWLLLPSTVLTETGAQQHKLSHRGGVLALWLSAILGFV